jgi:hypothetical protein
MPFPRHQNEHGQAMIEFSVVLLLMLTVIFGLLEVGNLALTWSALASAARAGARYAIVHGGARLGAGVDGSSGPGNNPPNVVSVVTSVATTAGLSAGNLTVSVTYPDGMNTTGHLVTVTATYPYTPMTVFLPFTSVAINITSTTNGMVCY